MGVLFCLIGCECSLDLRRSLNIGETRKRGFKLNSIGGVFLLLKERCGCLQ